MVPTMSMQAANMIGSTAQLPALIAQFEPISLKEMAGVTLLDRMETKYVMGLSQLCQALDLLTGRYRVLDIHGVRLNHYQTVYFDTPDFALYQQHHNGYGSRYKVRARRYVESQIAFFEIKHKTNRDRTVKTRQSVAVVEPSIPAQLRDFVAEHTPFQSAALVPKLWNDYVRVTLVSSERQERLTLDLQVAFHWNSASFSLPGIAIAEVKQDHRSQMSDFIQAMKHIGVRPSGFSKYTVGVYSLYDGIKSNNFKPQIQQVQRIMQKEQPHGLLH